MKGKLDLLVRNARRLYILHLNGVGVLLAQLLRLLLRYLTSAWIIFDQVNLIANEHDADVLLGRVKQRLKPVLDVVESLAVGHIVDDQASEGLPIVCDCDRPVLFLTCCIP